MKIIKDFTLRKLCMLLLLFFIVSSCSEEMNPPAEAVNQEGEIITLKNFLAEASRMPVSKIEYESKNAQFIIGQDVAMSLESARKRHREHSTSNDPNGRTTQRRHSLLLSDEFFNNLPFHPTYGQAIRVYAQYTVPSGWRSALDKAVKDWSEANSRIQVVMKETEGSDVIVRMDVFNELPPNVVARATFPEDGRPGVFILINSSYNSMGQSKKELVMVHELGHCFGFTHTDESFGSLIPETPSTDANSVMNSGAANTGNWQEFSFWDIVGFANTYPRKPGTKPLYRYFNQNAGDHFYTMSPNDLGPGAQGWNFQTVAAYLYNYQASGTTSLYRFWNAKLGDHLYTTNIQETNGLSGWVYEGVTGYVLSNYIVGSEAFKRYYNGRIADHYYGIGADPGNGYVYEGVQCYVY